MKNLSRRSFLGTAAAAAILPFSQASATSPKISRVMVQGRPQDTGSLYKVRNIMPALDALGGVRKMRCRAPFRNTPGWASYIALARNGVQFCFTLPVKDPSILVADLAEFERRQPGSIWAIEFPNEPDLNPVSYGGMVDKRLGARTGDAPALMAFCRDVTKLLSENSELSAVPRIAFNSYMQREQRELVTYANAHIYPRGNSGWKEQEQYWKDLLVSGGLPQGVITEWGRTTGGNDKNNVARPVSLEKQAELLGSDLKAMLAEPSVAAVSLYELLSWPGPGEQENFGLFNADMTARPVVSAIRSILG